MLKLPNWLACNAASATITEMDMVIKVPGLPLTIALSGEVMRIRPNSNENCSTTSQLP